MFENNEPVFIEANANSQILYYLKLYKNSMLLIKRLANYISSLARGKICIVVKKEKMSYHAENSLWRAKLLKKFIKGDVRLCYMSYNRKRITNGLPLIDSNGNEIFPSVLFLVKAFESTRKLEERGVNVINSSFATTICMDKFFTYKVVEKFTDIRFPKSFLVNDNCQLKKTLRMNKNLFKKGFILKPTSKTYGEGIHVFDGFKYPRKRLEFPYIIQERIYPPKIKGIQKYWDVRCFFITGKYFGSVKRVSSKPITNLAKGATPEKLEMIYNKKLSKVSIKVVNAIEKASRFAEKNGISELKDRIGYFK